MSWSDEGVQAWLLSSRFAAYADSFLPLDGADLDTLTDEGLQKLRPPIELARCASTCWPPSGSCRERLAAFAFTQSVLSLESQRRGQHDAACPSSSSHSRFSFDTRTVGPSGQP